MNREGRLPGWLDGLLEEAMFFAECGKHESARKNEKNIFCLHCCVSICAHCAPSHPSHALLQVRRYVYNDVVRLDDLQQLIDCSFIKPYTINGAKVIFLKPRPVSKPCKGPGTICLSCDRTLLDLFRYCSLTCKVDHLIARGIDVKRALLRLDESELGFTRFDGLQAGGSGALSDGDFDLVQGMSSPERADGGDMGNSVKDSRDLSARAMMNSSSSRRRKGTPHRSPPS